MNFNSELKIMKNKINVFFNCIYKVFSIYLMFKLNLHFWGDKLTD